MPINRRDFIKQQMIIWGGAISLKSNPFSLINDVNFGEKEKLTILHTNDLHSHIFPFQQDGSKYAGLGGLAERAALIEDIRKECPNVLLLDAGDIFQGTPYFDIFKGEPEINAMSRMKYDAVTIGEHDLASGIDNYTKQMSKANFPVVISNYEVNNTPLEGKTIPYKIITKGKLKVGVLGIGIDLKELLPEQINNKIHFLNPITSANTTAAILKKEGCQLVICLSHLGDWYFENKISDEWLAKESSDIDIILGGHTHRFFENAKTYKNQKKENVIVNQAGWGGVQMGRLDVTFYDINFKHFATPKNISIQKKN